MKKNTRMDKNVKNGGMIKAIKYNEKGFVFKGRKGNGRNRFVLEAIKQYIADYKGITFSQLRLAFPSTLQNKGAQSLGVFANKNEVPRNKKVRYFSKNNEEIVLDDGTVIVVCTQWGQENRTTCGNLLTFVNHVKNVLKLKLDIEWGDRQKYD